MGDRRKARWAIEKRARLLSLWNRNTAETSPKIANWIWIGDRLYQRGRSLMQEKSVQFTARRSTIKFSYGLFCELAPIQFVFGSDSRVSSVYVPINAYNEIFVQCYEIPKLFLNVDRDSVSTIDLSSIEIPWSKAVQQFARYLYPRHRKNKRNTNSVDIQVTFSASIVLPIYL
jgi:hypothetical protein